MHPCRALTPPPCMVQEFKFPDYSDDELYAIYQWVSCGEGDGAGLGDRWTCGALVSCLSPLSSCMAAAGRHAPHGVMGLESYVFTAAHPAGAWLVRTCAPPPHCRGYVRDDKASFVVQDERHLRIAARRLGRQRGTVGFGNARAVRNAYQLALDRQAERVLRERRQGGQPDALLLIREDLLGPR